MTRYGFHLVRSDSRRRLFVGLAFIGAALGASGAFADRLPISVTLDGGAPWTCTSGTTTDCDSNNGEYVLVQPGALITVSFTVTTNGTGTANDWFSTGWTVVNGGTSGCDNFSPNYTSSGTFTQTWTITAPATEGVFSLDLHARRTDDCLTGGCGCITLLQSILVKKIPNPPQPEACGFDMVLVLDSSGSLNNTELGQMKDAFEAFVAAFLPETPTEMAVVDFDTAAAVIQGFTSNEVALNAAINLPTSGGSTNWDDALLDARSLFPHRVDKPDIMVFASDGNPNRRGGHTALGHSATIQSVSETDALAWAVAEADAAKTAGVHIITLGIGTDLDAASLALISSPDALITSDFESLAADLAELALHLCGGTVTVHKVLDADGDLATTGDQSNGAGWTFSANAAPDSTTPASGPTDLSGLINFDVDLGADDMATVDVTETVQGGYILLAAECEEGGSDVGMPSGASVHDIPVSPLDIVSCTFYNTNNAGACCNLLTEVCTDGVLEQDCVSQGLRYGGDGSTCATINPPCACDAVCPSCTTKTGAGTRHVEVALVGSVFNGVSTTFTYRVCQGAASMDLSHWVLGLSETCCNGLLSATGGTFPGTSCSIDPSTGLYGLKFETGAGLPDCDGVTCGGGGALFTVTLSSNIGTGCVKTANKIDGAPANFYGCVEGPSCTACVSDADCNDGVSCTNDDCNEALGVCTHTPNDAKCSDGLFCNGIEVCDALQGCLDSPDPCAPPLFCNEGIDKCVNCLTDEHCDDGLYCNGLEQCEAGVCEPGADPCPSDGVDCTADSCNETTDTCVHKPNHAACKDGNVCTDDLCDPLLGCVSTPNNNLCNDGLNCTQFDRCIGGVCTGDPVDCSFLNDQCNVGVCVEATGLCVAQPTNEGGPCEDGLYCTVGKTCVAGACQGAVPRDCGDGIDCTVDTCDEENNVCVHTADDGFCNNGQFCDGTETCDADFGCVPGTNPCTDSIDCTVDTCDEAADQCVFTPDDSACQDGIFCNGAEICDPEVGCQPGVDPCPDDNVACTIDFCNEADDTCEHEPDDSACQNGQFCDGMEVCDPILGCQDAADPCPIKCDEFGDRCVECLTDMQCDDGLYCNGAETCNTVSGLCEPGANPCPPDSVDCTIDLCDEATDSCLHVPDHAFCQNGIFCDGVEGCHPVLGCKDGDDPCQIKCDEAGDRCVKCLTDNQCDDGVFCNGLETCDTVLGDCVPGPDPCPPDNVACTIDSCDEAADACLHTPDDSACQNLFFCDGMEVCDPLLGCQDGADPCSPPTRCDEPGDRCVLCLTDAQCDDGLFCNGIETCDALIGECQPGTSPCPSDSVDCTIDVCDEAADACLHIPDDSFCQNGDFCDGMEFCHPTLGCQDSADPCPIKCDEMGDRCVECLTDLQCDDGLYCNGAETCNTVTGLCEMGANPCPPDAVDCTVDMCDEATDTCLHVPNHDFCQNGLFCDGAEFCDPQLGCQDGADPCSVPQRCDELLDRCVQCLTDGQCDDGLFCNGTETCDVASGLCVPGADPCPPDGIACTVDGCSEAADMCTHKPDGSFCNDGNDCTADICDPMSGCQNPPLPSGTLCGNPTPQGPCDNSDVCDGAGLCVPNLKPPVTECRPSGGDCDVAEFCTGSSPDCPPDGFSPPVQCRPSAGVCDVPEFCTGSSPNCPTDGFQPPSFECRMNAGDCDVPEFCTGTSADCPADGFDPQGTICRASVDICDAVETCTGISAACPPDGFAPPMLCRPTAGPCDQEELCTGSGPSCPPDGFLVPGTTCRASAGVCDVPELCVGNSADCPPDGFQPNTLVCRTAADVCDAAEFCTGSSAVCPPDGVQPGTTVCRPAANVCDVAELCTGSSTACPNDGFQPDTVVCRFPDSECDAEELCTGISAECPPDLPAVEGTPCSDDGDECTDDFCSGPGAMCLHPDNGECGACCLGADQCMDDVTNSTCLNQMGVFLGPHSTCAEQGDNCADLDRIPTVSQWGLAVLALVLLTGAKLYFRGREIRGGATA